jgi:hypothetical protein
MTREVAREKYDALVGLDPRRREDPAFAFALVKVTYQIKDSAAVLAKPEPLLHDFWSDDKLEPRLPPGSDYWIAKPATDVVVRGAAFAPNGRPSASMFASVQIGNILKRVAVFGKRVVEWHGDRPAFGRPELFTEMPLIYQNAYGGLDNRVPIPPDMLKDYMQAVENGMQFDHPGLYPRNPAGKGYLVLPDPLEGVELPNLEDPSDLLTPERLITQKPELWYRQPLPWCFEWTNGCTFPRYQYLGIDAWFPTPENTPFHEVQRGFLPPDLRRTLPKNPSLGEGYYQEASLGMVFRAPLAGQPVVLTGMHPEEPSIKFIMPPDPSIKIEVEGEHAIVPSLLTGLTIYPAEKKFYAVYCGKTKGLKRSFIPGIHRNIPISASINGDTPIRYETPPTIKERLDAANAKPAGSGGPN